MENSILKYLILHILCLLPLNGCWVHIYGANEALEEASSMDSILSLLLLASQGQPSAASSTQIPPTTTVPAFLRIFVSSIPLIGGTLGGATAIDNNCMIDATYPGTGTYKAMIGINGSRVPCTTGDCSTGGASENINWVLQPNMEYRRASDSTTVIFTTNANSIFAFGTVTNSITSAFTQLQWTGLNQRWMLVDNCSDWSDSSSLIYGAIGRSDQTNNTSLSNVPFGGSGGAPCDGNGRLFCVEQP